MKSKFVKYLHDIDVPKTLIDRIEKIYLFYRGVCPYAITDIFVTDYLNENKQRQYENLWFFSSYSHCMEAKRFAAEDDFDLSSLRARVIRWHIRKQDYDFQKATSESRLALDVTAPNLVSCSLKASMNNCDYLKAIFRKYVVPNVVH